MQWVLVALLATALWTVAPPAPAGTSEGPGDAVVVAVIDSAFSPYHWDFLADKMPQTTNGDPRDDLPLWQPPDSWLPGFPGEGAFSSFERLDLTLDATNPDADPAGLWANDVHVWGSVLPSGSGDLHYYWMPGTKVIGAMTFGRGVIGGSTEAHGTGTTSVSVGNLNGTCPECVLVFLQYDDVSGAETALSWAMAQPWIDAITNSYGFSYPVDDVRGRVYNYSDVAGQQAASERGQTIFFSAGNGVENGYVVPNTTLMSSQEGPDWIVTVGAVTANPGMEPVLPSHASPSGQGKPADIASLGAGYPSAFEADSVGGRGPFGFGGTSNSTPVIAGTYARGLYIARRDLAGASRLQVAGMIAVGGGFGCGVARPDCELADGVLTGPELRARLFGGALHTGNGMSVSSVGPSLPPVGEDELLSEGHGSYLGRETTDDAVWLAEFDRLVGPLEGRTTPVPRPWGELEWMIVDSWCRQHIWGTWSGGYYRGDPSTLPSVSATWPVRSSMQTTCPQLQQPPRSEPVD